MQTIKIHGSFEKFFFLQVLHVGLVALGIRNWTGPGKGLMLPFRFFLLSSSFLVCEQLLKGIVYSLVVKHTTYYILFITKSALLSGAARPGSLPL